MLYKIIIRLLYLFEKVSLCGIVIGLFYPCFFIIHQIPSGPLIHKQKYFQKMVSIRRDILIRVGSGQ